MPGINKYNEKDRRRQRRQNVIAKDLASPKYHQRVIERKRYESENDDGTYYFTDRYVDDPDETSFG